MTYTQHIVAAMACFLGLVACAKGPITSVHQSRYVDGVAAKFSKKNVGLSYLSTGDSSLYWGMLSGTVLRIDAVTHKKQWSVKLDSSISTPIVTMPDRIFVGTTQGDVYALDQQTGKTIWRRSYGQSARGPMALWNNALAFVSLDGKVTVLDTNTGELLFQQSFFQSQSFTSAFAMRASAHDDYWVLALPSGEVLALDAAYEVIWKQAFPMTQSKNNFWATVVSLDARPDGTWVTPYMKAPFLLGHNGQTITTLDTVLSQTPPTQVSENQWAWAHQDAILVVDMQTRQVIQTHTYSQPSPLLSIKKGKTFFYLLAANGSLDVYDPRTSQTNWTYKTESSAKGQLIDVSGAYWFLNQRGQLFEIWP